MRGSMYPEIESWKEFYEELDPDKRKALYEGGLKEKEDDGANGLRGEFLELRYTDPRDPKHRVDNFLWQMVILPGFLRPIYFIRALGEREIKGIIQSAAPPTGNTGTPRTAIFPPVRDPTMPRSSSAPWPPATRRSWKGPQGIFTAWPSPYRKSTAGKRNWSFLPRL